MGSGGGVGGGIVSSADGALGTDGFGGEHILIQSFWLKLIKMVTNLINSLGYFALQRSF